MPPIMSCEYSLPQVTWHCVDLNGLASVMAYNAENTDQMVGFFYKDLSTLLLYCQNLKSNSSLHLPAISDCVFYRTSATWDCVDPSGAPFMLTYKDSRVDKMIGFPFMNINTLLQYCESLH
jgi:hypothetical protein